MSIDTAASKILQRGVQLDNSKRYTEALVCYQEGLQLLLDFMTRENDPNKKTYLRNKIEGYINRAEQIKKHINEQKDSGKYHEEISIEDNSKGHSYKNLFGRFLNEEVTSVEVEDPYIRSFHQCQNFLRLCELLVKSCVNLKSISLTTTQDGHQYETTQGQWFHMLSQDLMRHDITLNVQYSATLHDRKIMLSSGWIIKIGRGLDIYKPTENKFCLGLHDLELRFCHQTQVDIFHSKDVKKLL